MWLFPELLFLVLLSHSSSDVHGIAETAGKSHDFHKYTYETNVSFLQLIQNCNTDWPKLMS